MIRWSPNSWRLSTRSMLWRSEVRGLFGAFMTEDGNATAVRPYEDESILINMSVWESIESLGDYVYRTDHAAYLRRRREWFERLKDVIVALWWIPAGSLPTVSEGIERLELSTNERPDAASLHLSPSVFPDGRRCGLG